MSHIDKEIKMEISKYEIDINITYNIILNNYLKLRL